jgi:hypothetical protein
MLTAVQTFQLKVSAPLNFDGSPQQSRQFFVLALTTKWHMQLQTCEQL